MGTTVVRVGSATHALLKVISKQTGETMQRITERAIEEYNRRLFWERTNAAFAAMREDEDAWAEELSERKLWETTLSDGLEEGDHE